MLVQLTQPLHPHRSCTVRPGSDSHPRQCPAHRRWPSCIASATVFSPLPVSLNNMTPCLVDKALQHLLRPPLSHSNLAHAQSTFRSLPNASTICPTIPKIFHHPLYGVYLVDFHPRLHVTGSDLSNPWGTLGILWARENTMFYFKVGRGTMWALTTLMNDMRAHLSAPNRSPPQQAEWSAFVSTPNTLIPPRLLRNPSSTITTAA
jgi:hypothetical protein